jgi:PPK2 family polyphosphate:nucleotide phosphotransferase
MNTDRYRIEDGSDFRLSRIDPDDTGDFESKEEAEDATEKEIKKLRELHERFYVDNRYALLIVLQAMDTAGKDGTIKSIFSGINPVGCTVTSFKKPTAEELDHDFLWRIYKALPPKGNYGIFNRSHYEDVLVVRVHDLVPKPVWTKRYDHINEFERLQHESNTIIVKFFLHISKDEQKERLLARLEDPKKHWKFDPADLKERAHWDDYQEAYQDAIRKCSAPWAPWYVVPANKKWFRNYVVANALVKTLSKLSLKLPVPDFDPKKMKVV